MCQLGGTAPEGRFRSKVARKVGRESRDAALGSVAREKDECFWLNVLLEVVDVDDVAPIDKELQWTTKPDGRAIIQPIACFEAKLLA
jgi:hypothetical protein